MRPRYLHVSIVLLMIGSSPAAPQGWLAPAEPTFTTFTTGISLGDDATTYRGSLIRTFSNSLDLSLRGEWRSEDDDDMLVAEPGMTLYPFRSEDDPFTLGIGGTYGRAWFTGDTADRFESVTGERWSVFAGIYGAIPSGGMMLVPSVEARRIGAKVEVDAGGFGSFSESDQITQYAIGLAIVGGTTGDRYFMMPNLTIADGETRWSVTFGTLFGQTKDNRPKKTETAIRDEPRVGSRRVAGRRTGNRNQVSYNVLAEIQRGIPVGTSYPVSNMNQAQREALVSLFALPSGNIETVVWGESVVPDDDELSGSNYYRVVLSGGQALTMWVDEFGNILKSD